MKEKIKINFHLKKNEQTNKQTSQDKGFKYHIK